MQALAGGLYARDTRGLQLPVPACKGLVPGRSAVSRFRYRFRPRASQIEAVNYGGPGAARTHSLQPAFHTARYCAQGFLPRRRTARYIFRPRASQIDPVSDGNGSGTGRLQAAFRSGAARYRAQLVRELKSEAGIDLEDLRENAAARLGLLRERGEAAVSGARDLRERLGVARDEGNQVLSEFRSKTWPRIVSWHRWQNWKWDAQHVGALVLYLLLVIGSFQGIYALAIRPRRLKRIANEIAEAYLEAKIPEPTPEIIRKVEKLQWRENFPDGLRVEKHVLGPDGKYHHDPDYVGEHAWEDNDDDQAPKEASEEHKSLSWKERLAKLDKLLSERTEKENMDALTSKYVVLLDREELKKSIMKEKQERFILGFGRAFWVAKTWWKYRPKLPYLKFFEKVENMEVESAIFSHDMSTVYATMKEGFPSEYMVDVPADPYLNETLQRCEVEVDVLPQSRFFSVLRAYAILLPCVFVIYMLDNKLFNLRRNTEEKIVDLMRQNYSNMILPSDAEEAGFPTFNDVIVSSAVWSVVEEVSNYLSDPMRYYDKFIFFPRGILIHGPPGTGKTHIARAMARELKLPFIFASGSEFGDSDIPGPQKIFQLFFTARANAPSIVFIDEIDALAGKHVEDDPKRLRTFKQLLRELDGGEIDTEVHRFARRQAFILICATNRRDDLHEAFLQRQRIDRQLLIGLPKEEERLRIFHVHAEKYTLADDVDFKKVVYRTRGFSGADLKNFVDEVSVNAKQKGRLYISQSDLLDVLEKQLFERIGMTVTEEEQREVEQKIEREKKRLLAVHEAGHILLAHIFPRFDWHAFTHLLPGGKESALSVFYPSEEMLDYGGTIGYYRAQMVVAHGGRGAEKILLGDDITDGWMKDLAKISVLARECAVHPGNPKLGLLGVVEKPLFQRSQPDQLYYAHWNSPNSVVMPMDLEISDLVGREIQRYIDETEKMAMEGLQNNKHILERLTSELELRTKMTGDEVKEIILPMNPVMLPDIAGPPRRTLRTDELSPEEIRQMTIQGDYEDLDVYAAPLHRC